MIQGKHIHLSFSGKNIFTDLNFNISKGENVCICGPSGIGKSTLLHLLQGFTVPDKGEIMVGGLILNESNIHHIRHKIIWIPQNINLPVKNGIELLELMNVSGNNLFVAKFLKELGLNEDIIGEDFSKISVGQKQRVIIAIGLSIEKEVIIMDEPTASLDEESIRLLIHIMNKLSDKTIISASHNQIWMNHADQIISL